MIRLGLISDSHGRDDALGRIQPLAGAWDGLCHMGDFSRDGEMIARLSGKRLYGVRGNCDFSGNAPEEMTITVEGYKILICHGHRYGVKETMTRLSLRARAAGADIVLYGHTHIPSVDRDGPMLFVNPGALWDGRYGVLEFRPNGPVPLLKTI